MQPNLIEEIITLWFSERVRPLRFNSTPTFDREIDDRYRSLWRQAGNGELDDWQATGEGCLALVIILDQFPLHMFRNQAESFHTEQQARDVAAHAISAGFDRQMPPEWRAFLYLPFMHSESLTDQDRSVALYERAGLQDNLKWAKHHRDLILRFGRFPHRNAILGRTSTSEETAYLESDDAFTG